MGIDLGVFLGGGGWGFGLYGDGTGDGLVVLVVPAWDGDLLEVEVDWLGDFGVFGFALDQLHGLVVFAGDDADLDVQSASPC